MTSSQRMAAQQLAQALRDAVPFGAFDEDDFLAKLTASITPEVQA